MVYSFKTGVSLVDSVDSVDWDDEWLQVNGTGHCTTEAVYGGRYKDRTCDLFRVKETLSQLS